MTEKGGGKLFLILVPIFTVLTAIVTIGLSLLTKSNIPLIALLTIYMTLFLVYFVFYKKARAAGQIIGGYFSDFLHNLISQYSSYLSTKSDNLNRLYSSNDFLEKRVEVKERLDLIALKKESIAQSLGKLEKGGLKGLRKGAALELPDISDAFGLVESADRILQNELLEKVLSGRKLEEGLEKMVVELKAFLEISPDLIGSIISNVALASEPLTEEIFAIKQSVNNFIKTTGNWQADLSDTRNIKNFKNVITLYNRHKEGFEELIKKINSNITRLEDSFSSITGLVENVLLNVTKIETTASNIHILALNASIEAARAGEAGKGFKVIAGETRKLSNDTQNLLKNIVKVINDSRGLIESSRVEVKKDVEEIIKHVESQQKGYRSFSEVMEGYQQDFENIFQTIGVITDNIYEHINRISPTFQVHDIITQEMNNLSSFIKKVLTENRHELELYFKMSEIESRTALLNRLVDYLERTITTDGEVKILGDAVERYGLKRDKKIEIGSGDIQLF